MRFLPALCLLPTLVAALPRLLDNAIRANAQIYDADTTRFTQTFHDDPWLQESFPTNGEYAVRSRDLSGRPLEVVAQEPSAGVVPAMLYVRRFGWDGNMPLGRIGLNLSLGNSPSFEVARTYRGDSLVRLDSSWTSWDSAGRVLLVRSSQDTLCPFRDSIELDGMQRPVQRKICREGISTVVTNGRVVEESFRSWELIKLWYRSEEDRMPWREQDWVRDRDTTTWQLNDSGQTQGSVDQPTSLVGTYWISSQAGIPERAEYRWNPDGQLEGISYVVADTVQSTMEYAYDDRGRLVREITSGEVLDTVTWSYAQAMAQSVAGTVRPKFSVVRDGNDLRVVGEDAVESVLLDSQGRQIWRQGKGNLLRFPKTDGVTFLKIRTCSGERTWKIAPRP